MLERGWFPVLLAHSFLLQVIMMLLRVGMTYDAVAIGLDALWVGLIGGAFGAIPALLGLHTGRYIDRLGEGRALGTGSVLALVASAGLWLAPPSPAGLLLLSTVAGLSQFACVAAQHSSVGKAGGARQAASFGHLTMVISMAHMVGPLVFGALANRQPIPDTAMVFLAGSLFSLALVATALLLRIPRTAAPGETRGIWGTAGTILRTRGFLPATFASLVLFSAIDLLVIYLPLFGAERGMAAGEVALLLSLRGAASVISRLFFGWLYGAVGRGLLLVLALLLSGAAIALLPLAGSLAAMGVLVFVAGLGLGIGAPLSLAWIGEIIRPAMLGSALSLRLAFNRGGQVALPIAVGAVAASFGAGAIVLAIGGGLLVASGVSAVVGRTR